jgi:hypothetical protein
MHEWVELVKAFPWWPCVALIFLFKFEREIRQLLTEAPALIRRMRAARVPGMKVEFNELERSLPLAARETSTIQLPEPPVPTRPARKKKEN